MRWLRTLGLVVMALAVAGCGAAAPAGPAATAGPTAANGQLKVLSYDEISTGNAKVPAFTTAGEDLDYMDQIYDSLLTYDPSTLKIQPDLATSYSVSPDGRTWTFQLRKGVKWQGGFGDFTCADVQFTWDFNKDPANKSFWQSEARIVDKVDCPDPYTAVIQLTAPFQGFIWNVVNVQPNTGLIMSKAAWAKLGKAGYEKTPIGTGPFMLKSLTPGQSVIMVRNPDYWGPRPWADELDFKVIADYGTAALAVKSGSLDMAFVDPVTASEYQNTPGVKVVAQNGLNIQLLEPNELVKPFDNVLVRQAMRYAIDDAGMVKTVFRGFAAPGYQGLVLPQESGYDASVNPLNVYDPAKAKQLLAQAGVKLPITGFFDTYNDTLSVNVAQFVAANLAAVGINLQAHPLERGTLTQDRALPATPAVVLGTTLSPDPDFLLNRVVGTEAPPKGLTFTRYPGINDLFTQQESAATADARSAILKQIQQKLTADAPDIELYVAQNIWVVSDRVQGFQPTPLYSGPFLAKVSLSGS